MRKEIILAIVIGLAVGLILTYGIYLARTALRRTPSQEITSNLLDASPEPSGNSLSIVSPEDETVQIEKTSTIAGATIPESLVVIFVNNDPVITTADTSGNFSTEAELETGSNVIIIHSLDENGRVTTTERTVVVVASLSTPNASESANES